MSRVALEIPEQRELDAEQQRIYAVDATIERQVEQALELEAKSRKASTDDIWLAALQELQLQTESIPRYYGLIETVRDKHAQQDHEHAIGFAKTANAQRIWSLLHTLVAIQKINADLRKNPDKYNYYRRRALRFLAEASYNADAYYKWSAKEYSLLHAHAKKSTLQQDRFATHARQMWLAVCGQPRMAQLAKNKVMELINAATEKIADEAPVSEGKLTRNGRYFNQIRYDTAINTLHGLQEEKQFWEDFLKLVSKGAQLWHELELKATPPAERDQVIKAYQQAMAGKGLLPEPAGRMQRQEFATRSAMDLECNIPELKAKIMECFKYREQFIEALIENANVSRKQSAITKIEKLIADFEADWQDFLHVSANSQKIMNEGEKYIKKRLPQTDILTRRPTLLHSEIFAVPDAPEAKALLELRAVIGNLRRNERGKR